MLTHRNSKAHAARWALALIVLLMIGPAKAQAQSIHVALQPSPLEVNPDDVFTLDINVTQAGLSFNGFDATITYDPAALEFQSNTNGAYMTGACATAPFHQFTPGTGTLSITDVILCDGVSLPGPGQLYRLTFKASSTPQVTHVRFGSIQFYNDGLFVNPVISSDAGIAIGVPLAVGPRLTGSQRLRLSGAPNPFRGQTSISVESGADGWQDLRVSDLQGRWVRHLDSGTFAAGIRHVAWDGRDDSGRDVAAGVYFYRVVTARATSEPRRLTIVR